MFKLYKRDEAGQIAAYHEAWAEPERRRIVEHWGLLGREGETSVHRIWFFGSLEKQFSQILEPAKALGFAEIDIADYQVMTVEFAADFEPQTELQGRLHEVLGWTGLGYCESGETRTDAFQVTCFVLDFDLAKSVIEDALKDSEFGDYSRIYQE